MGAARKQQPGGFHITERDVAIVRFIGRTRLATVDEIRVRFAMARSKAYARLRGLVEHGLLIHDSRVPGHGVYLATASGLALAGLDLAPATVSLGALRHDLAVAAVVAQFEAADVRLQTERELRQHVHATGDNTYRPSVVRRGMRDARHWPDLVLVTHSAQLPGWGAIEVELTRKSAERTRAILTAYKNSWASQPRDGLWGVLYIVPTRADARRIAQLGSVARLTPSSRPAALGIHSLDQATHPLATLADLLTRRSAARAADQAAKAQRDARRREVEARHAADAAHSQARERQREQELAAAQAAATARRGLGRLIGGGR
jgi:hypothetical protein